MFKFNKLNKTNSYTFKNISYAIFLFSIITLFLGIGYAKITGIDLEIDGEASINASKELYISNIEYQSSIHGDASNSVINSFYKTLLDSKIVLDNDKDSSITYQITVTNSSNKIKQYKETIYDNNFYDNLDITYEINEIDTSTLLQPNESKSFTITFKYKEEKDYYDNTTLNSCLNFVFDDFSSSTDEYDFGNSCSFHGQNNDITGDCVGDDEHVDYINTGLKLFSEENYKNDFEIGFTIDNIESSRFKSGKVDTIFSCINENSPYPGIVLRIQDSKWFLQVGGGTNNQKIEIEKDQFQSFKLKKVGNEFYYSLDDGDDIFITDLTGFARYFDSTLTFGGALNANGNPMPERYLIGDLSNLYVNVTKPAEDNPEEIDYDQMILDFVGEEMNTVFEMNEAHTFDGTTNTTFHTNINLFSEENYQKSFIVSFEIDEFNMSDNANQATLFNAKDESNSTYPGIVFRKANNRYELSVKDGVNVASSISLPDSIKKMNIIKKGMELFYQYDQGEIKVLGNSNNIDNYPVENCFDIDATFGSNINGSGSFGRIMKGTLSHMKIRLGN